MASKAVADEKFSGLLAEARAALNGAGSDRRQATRPPRVTREVSRRDSNTAARIGTPAARRKVRRAPNGASVKQQGSAAAAENCIAADDGRANARAPFAGARCLGQTPPTVPTVGRPPRGAVKRRRSSDASKADRAEPSA